jgi:alkylated DNA repair dioxygenase AlkB
MITFDTPTATPIVLGEGDAAYYPNFLTTEEADALLTRLNEELEYIPREEMTFTIFNKVIPPPRDKAFLGDVDGDDGSYPLYHYDHSGNNPIVQSWTPTTEHIRDIITRETGQRNNHLVANRYVDGNDHIGLHQDKARDFATGSSVMTLSLGGARRFQLQHNTTKKKQEVLLEHGLCLYWGPRRMPNGSTPSSGGPRGSSVRRGSG